MVTVIRNDDGTTVHSEVVGIEGISMRRIVAGYDVAAVLGVVDHIDAPIVRGRCMSGIELGIPGGAGIEGASHIGIEALTVNNQAPVAQVSAPIDSADRHRIAVA